MDDEVPWHQWVPFAGPDAREADIFFAYRLLLGRLPDRGGWATHVRRLEERLLPSEIAETFLSSSEYRSRGLYAAVSAQSEIEVPLDGYVALVPSEDAHIGEHIRAGTYEPHVLRAIRGVLRPGHVFVDVGANIGFFTALAAHLVGAEGRVVAVEPMDKNAQIIYRMIHRNGFSNVDVRVCAAGERERLVSMTSNAATSNAQALSHVENNRRSTMTQVKTLDVLTAELHRIDVVKLDIEGFELFALRGFRQQLERHRPVLFAEFHPYCMRTFLGIDPEDYLDELFSLQREIFVLDPDETVHRMQNRAAIIEYWQSTNERHRADGTMHLDLMVGR